MRQKPGTRRTASEKTIKDIRRTTRKQFSAEDKIRIVLNGLRGEETIAELWQEGALMLLIMWKRISPRSTKTQCTLGFDQQGKDGKNYCHENLHTKCRANGFAHCEIRRTRADIDDQRFGVCPFGCVVNLLHEIMPFGPPRN